ncbi:diacylglycerol kinase [Candidatus Falkowbacteria bacterium RBG_13_39_14]|uniref:Dihydrofolate reductase n=1 Tax=Candidatus Falkowbacteria bacterium RBG_13_39_14 TaxID=1797985 RepID=A0A1F5S9Q1_9BACT|nr:MAG: diacylglycerol kinase [Candidatus Falkowbacteria bacterium RBG_13_39_14]
MISIICIIGQNRAIGKDNKLIWHIPDDLKHFKKITFGHPVIMGRKTFESIGKPLPDRLNIVITRDKNYEAEGCYICHSLDEALEYAESTLSPFAYPAFMAGEGGVKPRISAPHEIFIIGGGEIYRQAIPLADKLYLTIVEDSPEDADTFFPDYSEFKNIINEESREYNGLRYKFAELTR